MENKLQQFHLDLRKSFLIVGKAVSLKGEKRFAISLQI